MTKKPYRIERNTAAHSVIVRERDHSPLVVCEVSNYTLPYAEELVKAANMYSDLVKALSGIMHYASMGASVCDVNTLEQPEFVNARAVLKEVGELPSERKTDGEIG